MKKALLMMYGLLILAGCSNNIKFVKKANQTDEQFRNDMMYCKGEALGQWSDRNGVSQVNLRSQQMGPMSYEDCMLQMGYSQSQ